jgi:hypothetical protein
VSWCFLIWHKTKKGTGENDLICAYLFLFITRIQFFCKKINPLRPNVPGMQRAATTTIHFTESVFQATNPESNPRGNTLTEMMQHH